jgi:hypothetical protein
MHALGTVDEMVCGMSSFGVGVFIEGFGINLVVIFLQFFWQRLAHLDQSETTRSRPSLSPVRLATTNPVKDPVL